MNEPHQFTIDEAALLPHEKFFISQGLLKHEYQRQEENLPPFVTHSAYCNPAVQKQRLAAHSTFSPYAFRLQHRKAGLGLSPGEFEALLAFARVELATGTLTSAGALALMLHKACGPLAAHYAAPLYAAAKVWPQGATGSPT